MLKMNPDHFWSIGFAAYFGVMLLTGGVSQPSSGIVYLHSVLSLAILAISLSRLAIYGFPGRFAIWGGAIATLSLGLVLLQLAPLPGTLWSTLPLRDVALHNFALLQQVPHMMPLSLAPEQTRLAALALLPALAAFFGTLTLRPRDIIFCVWFVLACAAASVVFALLQYFEGPVSAFYLYEPSTNGVGVFNNQNFFAAQLYTAIIFVSLATAYFREKYRMPLPLMGTLAALYIGMLLAGLSLSGSRAGILLSMLAVPAALVLLYGNLLSFNLGTSAAALLAMMLALFIIGQSSMVGLLRISNSDMIDLERATIAANSLHLLKESLPFGTGFGSFVPLYQMSETPQTLMPVFVNHVHDDWLEIAIEGGFGSLLLELAFIVLVALTTLRIWRFGNGARTALFQRGATLALPLLLMHSLVDYPLRTPALMTLFAFLCGLLLLPPVVTATSMARPLASGEDEASRIQFRRSKARFNIRRRTAID